MQSLLPVMVEVTVQHLVRPNFMQIGRHLVRPYAIAIFAGFFHRVGAETDDFALNHHVEAIAIGQRLGHFNIQVVFSHFQHFTHRQADKFR